MYCLTPKRQFKKGCPSKILNLKHRSAQGMMVIAYLSLRLDIAWFNESPDIDSVHYIYPSIVAKQIARV